MNKINTDVCIVGAGPAGVTLALFLAKKKIPHVLVDKAIFPRDKICGDGFTLEVLRTLKEHSKELFEEFVSAPWVEPSDGFLIQKDDQKIHYDLTGKVGKMSANYVAKRKDFDDWYLSKIDQNYTQLFTGTEVTEINREQGTVYIKATNASGALNIESKLIIGADGERSIVRKTFHPKGIKKDRVHTFGAIRCYYKNVERVHPENPLEFYVMSHKYWGYFWIFHLPNNECNVGIGGLSEEISKNKVKLREEIDLFINSDERFKKRFEKAEQLTKLEGWGIPLNSDAYGYTGDNFMLIGDSAKFAEPLTGKGIGIAMYLSFLAVPTIEQAIKSGDYSKDALFAYERKMDRRFRLDWDVLSWLQRNFYKKRTLNLFMGAFRNKFIYNFIGKKMAKSFIEFVNKPDRKA